MKVVATASKGSKGEGGFVDVWKRGYFAWEYKRKDKQEPRQSADVPPDARPLIRQSAIMAAAAKDPRLTAKVSCAGRLALIKQFCRIR